MSFAKWVFRIAGVYGTLVLVPFYFLENDPRAVPPPPLTHPEYYYGFIGVGLAWQAAFLVISRDPVKYRWMMVPGIIEKASFGAAVIWLYVLHRIDAHLLPACAIDLTLGLLFLISFFRLRSSTFAKASVDRSGYEGKAGGQDPGQVRAGGNREASRGL